MPSTLGLTAQSVHAELRLHGGMVMLGSQKGDEYGRTWKSPAELGGINTCSIYVVVPDAEAAYKRAQSAGATIVKPLEDTHYGSREFIVKDSEGQTWSVGTYDPWVKQALHWAGRPCRQDLPQCR